MKTQYAVLIASFFFSFRPSYGQAENWQQLPGPTGGYVLSLSIHPQNQQVLYAGTRGGDLYKSTNGGVSWFRVYSFGSNIWSVAVDPLRPSTVYVGTETSGLYQTADDGNSWSNISPTTNQITRVVIDPGNNSNVYVAVKGDGIYKSTNGGSSWSLVTVGLSDNQIYSLAIDPINSQVLYAGGASSVYKTQSAGSTWSSVYSPYSTITSINIDPNNHLTVLIGTLYGIFKSTDGGSSWNAMSNGLANGKVHSFLISPTNSSILYAGTEAGLFKSLTGGSSWVMNYMPAGQTIVNAICVNQASPSELFIGCDGDGIFHTTTSGNTWQAANAGLLNVNVWKTVSDPVNQNILYAGTEIGGVFKSTDWGTSWTLAKQLQNVYTLAIDPIHPTTVYAGTYGNGIYKSQDGGKTWGQYNNGLSNTNLWDIAIDPSNPSVLYVATEAGIFKSADGASGWVQAYGSFLEGCYSVAVNPTNSNVVYLGSGVYDGPVKMSTDGGSTWRSYGSGIDFENILALKAVSLNPNTLFAGGVYFGFGTYSGLYRLSEGASTWTKAIDNFYCSEVVHKVSPPTEMYASSFNAGIYRSMDGGSSWNPISTSLPYATSDAVCVVGNWVYVAFRYAGIWKTATVTGVTDQNAKLPVNLSLAQNYPNPFNPSTTIEFSLAERSFVKLTILNILGQEIETLVNSELGVGVHEVRWNAAKYPSGMYFYRLQAGEFVETKKLVLLR